MVMPPELCLLCSHPGSKRVPASDRQGTTCYHCPRCGFYHVVNSVAYGLQRRKDDLFRLACVAVEHKLGQGPDGVTGFVLIDERGSPSEAELAFPGFRIFELDDMLKSFPHGSQLLKRAMLNLSRMVSHPTDPIPWDVQSSPYALFTCRRDLDFTTHELEEAEYVKIYSGGGVKSLRIRPKGWDRIAEWEQSERKLDSSQAFVAMWFTSDMQELYRTGIEPAIKRAGFTGRKIDLVEHNNEITDEIITEIRKSRFVVADFTAGRCRKCEECKHKTDCKDQVRPRGGVYYEAGFAKGLGLEVIWIVHKDQLKQTHFDIRERNFIDYADAEDLKERLYNRIVATIGQGTAK